MNWLTPILSIIIFISALLLLRAEYFGPRAQVYLFKPLTTILILLIALTANPPRDTFYQYAIVVGLVFSLAGDVFLMLPSDRFIAGLATFLLAHFAYIVAFTANTQLLSAFWSPLPFLIYAIVLLRVLLPRASKMRVPVLAYGIVITVMAWRAFEQGLQFPNTKTLFAFGGAVLFVISDSTLAVNRFVKKFHAAQLIILGTYFAAQWLIALSV